MKLLIFLVALLNALDAYFTYYGLTNGLIEEGNPIMATLTPNQLLVGKLFLSALLLSLINRVPKKKTFYLLLSGALIVYLFIMGMHFYWLSVV